MDHDDQTASPSPLGVAAIIAAIEAGRLDCHFQPIVRLSDGAPVAFEALSRLRHPVHGVLPAEAFIPRIEAAGLALRLTEPLLRRALGGPVPALLHEHGLSLTINLPLDVLLLPATLALVDRHRTEAGIAAGRLLIELTESRPVRDVAALDVVLQRWRAAGYPIAIDDIGPDMEHQAELLTLPFHAVKLDKAAVVRARDKTQARDYLQRIIAMAQGRSIQVIAEGIEDWQSWKQMRDMGVDHAQGYLIARALPPSAVAGWLAGWVAPKAGAA